MYIYIYTYIYIYICDYTSGLFCALEISGTEQDHLLNAVENWSCSAPGVSRAQHRPLLYFTPSRGERGVSSALRSPLRGASSRGGVSAAGLAVFNESKISHLTVKYVGLSTVLERPRESLIHDGGPAATGRLRQQTTINSKTNTQTQTNHKEPGGRGRHARASPLPPPETSETVCARVE